MAICLRMAIPITQTGRLASHAVLPVRIICLVNLCYVAAIVVLSTSMTPRYLLPLVPGVVLLLSVATMAARSPSRPAGAPSRMPTRSYFDSLARVIPGTGTGSRR